MCTYNILHKPINLVISYLVGCCQVDVLQKLMRTRSRPTSRAGSRTGSRASSPIRSKSKPRSASPGASKVASLYYICINVCRLLVHCPFWHSFGNFLKIEPNFGQDWRTYLFFMAMHCICTHKGTCTDTQNSGCSGSCQKMFVLIYKCTSLYFE